MVMPFALSSIVSSSARGRGRIARAAEKILQERKQRVWCLCRHHVHRIDQFEARTGDGARELLACRARAHLVEAAGDDHGWYPDLLAEMGKVGPRDCAI